MPTQVEREDSPDDDSSDDASSLGMRLPPIEDDTSHDVQRNPMMPSQQQFPSQPAFAMPMPASLPRDDDDDDDSATSARSTPQPTPVEVDNPSTPAMLPPRRTTVPGSGAFSIQSTPNPKLMRSELGSVAPSSVSSLYRQRGARRGPNIPDTPMSSSAATPQRRFGHSDDASDSGSVNLDVNPALDDGGGAGAADGAVIWGTTVDPMNVMSVFRDFLQMFEIDPFVGPHYLGVLEQIQLSESFNINIDCQHLVQHSAASRDLYQKLIMYPQEIIPLMDLVVHEEFCRSPEREAFLDERVARIQVRVFNLGEVKRMRELDPEDIDKLVSLKGMVLRASALIPDMKQAFFRCSVCARDETVAIDRGHIHEPVKCGGCKKSHPFRLVHNRCVFTDKQVVKLQESPDNIPEGETPATVTLLMYDALVDTSKPGDRVLVTGILRATPVRIDPRKRTVKATYKMHIDVLHVRKTAKGRINVSQEKPTTEVRRFFCFLVVAPHGPTNGTARIARTHGQH